MTDSNYAESRIHNVRRFRWLLVFVGFSIWSIVIASSLVAYVLTRSIDERSLQIPTLAVQILIAIGVVAPVGLLFVTSILKRDYEHHHGQETEAPALTTNRDSRMDVPKHSS